MLLSTRLPTSSASPPPLTAPCSSLGSPFGSPLAAGAVPEPLQQCMQVQTWCNLALGCVLPLILLRLMELHGRAKFEEHAKAERRRLEQEQDPAAPLPVQLPAAEGQRGAAAWRRRWREASLLRVAGQVLALHASIALCWLLAQLLNS